MNRARAGVAKGRGQGAARRPCLGPGQAAQRGPRPLGTPARRVRPQKGPTRRCEASSGVSPDANSPHGLFAPGERQRLWRWPHPDCASRLDWALSGASRGCDSYLHKLSGSQVAAKAAGLSAHADPSASAAGPGSRRLTRGRAEGHGGDAAVQAAAAVGAAVGDEGAEAPTDSSDREDRCTGVGCAGGRRGAGRQSQVVVPGRGCRRGTGRRRSRRRRRRWSSWAAISVSVASSPNSAPSCNGQVAAREAACGVRPLRRSSAVGFECAGRNKLGKQSPRGRASGGTRTPAAPRCARVSRVAHARRASALRKARQPLRARSAFSGCSARSRRRRSPQWRMRSAAGRQPARHAM
jgi:hypothetical protein